MRKNTPLLQGVFGNYHRSGGGVELTRGFQEHVSHEATQVGLTRETLEIAADHGIGLREFGYALLRRTFALTADVIYQSFPVQCGADYAGGGLKGR